MAADDYHARQRKLAAQRERDRERQLEASFTARQLARVGQKLGASDRMRQLTAAATPPRVVEGAPERATVTIRQFHRIPAGDEHDARSSCWCGPTRQPGLTQAETYWQHRVLADFETAPSPFLSAAEMADAAAAERGGG